MMIGKKINYYRKLKKMTQEGLAQKVGVSFQTISSWENDEYQPLLEKLDVIAKALDISVADLFLKEQKSIPSQDRMFNEDHMYKHVKMVASGTHLEQTMIALPYALEKHQGQVRKGKDEIPYINHPLLMACHALALGLCEDELLATILLHDVCEDCFDENGNHIQVTDLPVNSNVKEAVKLLTKPEDEYEGWRDDYFAGIQTNRLAVITKVLDRCQNISSMATGFKITKIKEYINTSEVYVFPLLDMMKYKYGDTCYNASFLIRYQMVSVLESLKRVI